MTEVFTIDEMEKLFLFKDGLRRDQVVCFPRFPFLNKVAKETPYGWKGRLVKLSSRFGRWSTFDKDYLITVRGAYPNAVLYLSDHKIFHDGLTILPRLLIGKVAKDEWFVLAPFKPDGGWQ